MQLLRMSVRSLGSGHEDDSHAFLLAALHCVAQITTLLTLEAKRWRLDQGFGADRHQHESRVAIIALEVHLVEGWNPVLTLAVNDEILQPFPHKLGRTDRISQREGRATLQR